MDLALRPTEPFSLESDLALCDDGISFACEPSLYNAVRLSLFCRARALPGDELPQGAGAFGEDLGGWWGSAFLSDSGELGSRLWTLRRSALTDSTRQRARDFALEALQWLVETGIASDVLVEPLIPERDVLRLDVTIVREDAADAQFEFDCLWKEI